MQQISALALAIFCVLLTTAAQIALKIGVSSPALASLLGSGNSLLFFVRAAVTPLVVTGLVLYAASAVLWLLVLARADLSYAFPLVSVGFVVSAAYAHLALHEPLGTGRVVGIALIVIGVVFVSRS